MVNKEEVKTRLAPSPSGELHLGIVRTALINYLFAKKKNGSFVLRIEDTDKERSSEEYVINQYNDLCWLNLKPDESLFLGNNYLKYRQSERLNIYEIYLNKLLNENKAYRCFCTEEELAEEKKEYLSSEKLAKNYKYSRKCLYLNQEIISINIKKNKSYLIRFLVDNNKHFSFNDGVRGYINFFAGNIEDFVIARRDKTPLLNFAVVIDDYEMGITDVIRAEEHLSNTAKQIAIYESFNWKVPNFFHISIILNPERKKISKRDKKTEFFTIKNLRELGYLPESIINYLFFLGWSPISKETEIFSLNDMKEAFDEHRLSSRPSVFSLEKLNWFNNQWINLIDKNRFDQIADNFIPEQYKNDKNIKLISRIFKKQLNNFSELHDLVKIFFFDKKVNVQLDEDFMNSISDLYKVIIELEKWNEEIIKLKIRNKLSTLKKEEKKSLLMNIRKILTGTDKGPEIHLIFYLMGKEKIKEKFLNFI
jgi:nondiscriminating glutamyl-tRNA synthetase